MAEQIEVNEKYLCRQNNKIELAALVNVQLKKSASLRESLDELDKKLEALQTDYDELAEKKRIQEEYYKRQLDITQTIISSQAGLISTISVM